MQKPVPSSAAASTWSEETNNLSRFRLLPSRNASEKSARGSPMNNDSAKQWHQRGVHVRQKEPGGGTSPRPGQKGGRNK
eukprot:scaffold137576_cov72-Phaeocystis_antarctica.AAC.3